MTTDPVVTVVFFAIGFLLLCGAGAIVCHIVEWRDEFNAKRSSRRCRVLIARYGYEMDSAPDYVPSEWKQAA